MLGAPHGNSFVVAQTVVNFDSLLCRWAESRSGIGLQATL
jgi:hypothetical protein